MITTNGTHADDDVIAHLQRTYDRQQRLHDTAPEMLDYIRDLEAVLLRAYGHLDRGTERAEASVLRQRAVRLIKAVEVAG